MQPSNDLSSQFALAIFRVNGLLMRVGDRITQAIGQSSARWQVLGRIGASSQTVAQMAREMGLARQSVQRVADVLVSEGLAKFTILPRDKRTKLVEITSTGLTVLAEIYKRNEEWSQRFQAKIEPDTFLQVIEELGRISLILEEDF